MANLLEIAQSWFSVVHHTPEQKATADERLEVCDGCEEKRDDLIRGFICQACGCPLRAKAYSPRGPAACPKGKWVR